MQTTNDLQAWTEGGQGFISGIPLHKNTRHLIGHGIDDIIALTNDSVVYIKTDGTKERRSIEAIPDKDLGKVIVVGEPSKVE